MCIRRGGMIMDFNGKAPVNPCFAGWLQHVSPRLNKFLVSPRLNKGTYGFNWVNRAGGVKAGWAEC